MKIGVLLHGSGVYDGTEIQEAVFSLLAIAEAGHEYLCIAPNIKQHHVVNHLNGDEMLEERNVLIESARIARGEVIDLKDLNLNDIDALVMPGGFGTAKNFTKWAFNGPKGEIVPEIKSLVFNCLNAKKPIAALCMSPTTVAKALEGSNFKAQLSVGTIHENSPYDIAAISQGMESVGAQVAMKSIKEISVDKDLKIVSAPCYMMNANILEVKNNIKQAVEALINLV